MKSRIALAIPAAMVVAITTAISPPTTLACSFGGRQYSYQSSPYIYHGVGGYVYTTQTSVNDVNNDHVVYSFFLFPNTSCNNAVNNVEIGQVLGATFGGAHTSWTVFTFNPNYQVYGNGSTCDSGNIPAAFYSYGSPASSNEGYWEWYDGYHVPGDYGETEYHYTFAYGSLSNTAPNGGWLPTTSTHPQTNSEVYQGNTGVACESTDAYWGTNNGTPSTTYQMVLSSSSTSTPSFSQWTDSSTGTSHPVYSWDELQNWWAAHSHGSPS